MVGKYVGVFFVLVATSAVAGDIVKWTDANGKVHYSDKAPAGIQSRQVANPQGQQPAAPSSQPAASSSQAATRARIDDADAVPYLQPGGRTVYREFLSHPSPRAFVICPDGRFATMYVVGNYQDKLDKMLKERQPGCEPYVVNDAVVWGGK